MSWLRKEDYLKENLKTRPRSKQNTLPKHVTKGKNPQQSVKKARLIHCPRLCQQTESGRYGRKTYDPITKHCYGCDCDF